MRYSDNKHKHDDDDGDDDDDDRHDEKSQEKETKAPHTTCTRCVRHAPGELARHAGDEARSPTRTTTAAAELAARSDVMAAV